MKERIKGNIILGILIVIILLPVSIALHHSKEVKESNIKHQIELIKTNDSELANPEGVMDSVEVHEIDSLGNIILAC